MTIVRDYKKGKTMATKKKKYITELDKMLSVKKESQTIGAFLEWLEERGTSLGYWHGDEYIPYRYGTINDLLATYFEIDLNQVEREQQAMLAELRKEHHD
jgi:hypothetical protein